MYEQERERIEVLENGTGTRVGLEEAQYRLVVVSDHFLY